MNNDTITTDIPVRTSYGTTAANQPATGPQAIANNLKAKTEQSLSSCEAKIRQEPLKSVLLAAGGGYCLAALPVTAIVAVPIRLAAVLAKPALLALGAYKLYGIMEKKSR